MESLAFGIFFGWLLVKIFWSVLRMVLIFGFGWFFIFSPILAVLVWALLFLLILLKPSSSISLFSPAPLPLEQTETYQQKIQSQIQFWETVRAQQPTSRDVLLNLANLYTADGNEVLATTYRQQAEVVDPNFSF